MSIWTDLLLAYLHDPPDKALSIIDHVRRACRYAGAALGRDVTEAELTHAHADQVASAIERLPMPTAGENARRSVGPTDGALTVFHPLSGATASVTADELMERSVEEVREVFRRLGQWTDDPEQRWLAVWRLLPDSLAERQAMFDRLPADTRVPDHTIWNHLDITAGFYAAFQRNQGAALLSFAVGPVQPFIAAARTVRDLWTGSMILSWLTFQAMLPVIRRLGPTAFVYPSLRGLPMLDLWLRNEKGLKNDGPGGELVKEPAVEARLAPCLPNRFLAVVPWGEAGCDARELAQACESHAREAWREMADVVRRKLAREVEAKVEASLRVDWDHRWDYQVDNYFDFRTAVLPCRETGDEVLAQLLAGKDKFKEAFPDAAAVRGLSEAMPKEDCPSYLLHSQCNNGHNFAGKGFCPDCAASSRVVGRIDNAGQWQYRLEVSARLMQAQRSIRHVPPPTEVKSQQEQVPPKCSLIGSYEQMGPAGLDDSRKFWEQAAEVNVDGVRLRERERLCAVALVKRFAGPCFFAKKLDLEREHLRYEDTSTVAAAVWLDRNPVLKEYAESRRGSQWLHWASPTQGREDDEKPVEDAVWQTLLHARAEEQPPTYYAVLMMDGDEMGKWLRGDKSPPVGGMVHPKLISYFSDLQGETEHGLDRSRLVQAALGKRRPVGPALHAAISEALSNFALHFVPEIIERRHKGTLIYAGGDDILALLPARTALACASELRNTFRENWKRDHETNRERLLMGEKATVSAGLAVVHYKEDLRFALDAARTAEKAAKNAGRDALQITVCRRSGEHATAFCPWDFAGQVDGWVQIFSQKASDRWAYHLRNELKTLRALDVGAMQAELKRQISRTEELTRRLFGEGDLKAASQRLVAAFDAYRMATQPPDGDGRPGQRRWADDGEAFSQFITLCQSASFLARGRDE